MASQGAGRFWGGEESASSSSSSDSDSEVEQKPQPQQQAKRAQMGRWAEESSSDDDRPQRVAPTSRADKRLVNLKEIGKQLKNHIKIEDFSQLTTDYNDLIQSMEKFKSLGQGEVVPNYFIKTIVDLQNFVFEFPKEKAKKLNQNKHKAYNGLKAKLRKGKERYEEELKHYEEHPSEFEEEEADDEHESDAESSGSESDDGGSSSASSAEEKKGKKASSGSSDSGSNSDSSSGSDSGSDSDSESWDSSESESDEDLTEEERRTRRMQKWLKTESDYEEERLEKEKREAQERAREERKIKKDAQAGTAGKKKDDKGRKDSTVEQKQDENMSFEECVGKVKAIAEDRGRKTGDRRKNDQMLEEYFKKLDKFIPNHPFATNWKIRILGHFNSLDFDYSSGAFVAMRPEVWLRIHTNAHRTIDILETWEDKYFFPDEVPERDEKLYTAVSYTDLITGFVSHLERLDDELYKGLQFSGDATTPEFQSTLANHTVHIRMLERALAYCKKEPTHEPEVGKISARLLEQYYFKHDDVNVKIFERIAKDAPKEEKARWVWPTPSLGFIEELRRSVHGSTNVRAKLRALLCQAYHLAVHDKYREARNLFHFTNLAERSAEATADVNTQILYNHTVAQMGLCAFRAMMIPEAHNALVELCMYMKTKELLAQGMSYSRFQERNADQEKMEKKRQVPYHMHIDLDYLESVHLISAMLLEIPHMAHQHLDPTKQKEKPISRLLHRHLFSQTLPTGQTPPENARETVVAAARFLKKSDWKSCIEMCDKLRFWSNIPNPEPVRKGLHEKIKIEALRTFMFYSLTSYDSFHLDQLCAFFELEAMKVHSTLSKMIINNEIPASWDSTSKFVVVQRSDLTNLHKLALQLSDRVQHTLDNNERSLDIKCGTKDNQFQQKGANNMQRGGWDQQNNRRGFQQGKGGRNMVMAAGDERNNNRKGGGKGKGGNHQGYNRGGSQNWNQQNRGQQGGFRNQQNRGGQGGWNNQR